MRIVRLALIIGAVVTVLGGGLFYALPNANTYLYVPGCMMAFMANGGGHEMHIRGVAWDITALLFNFVFYSVVSYWLVWMFLTLAGRNVASDRD
jgi:hypothetical protein